MTALTCFKAYDIRGRIPSELNEGLAYQIGQAYAAFVRPKNVAVGRDIRATSQTLSQALIRGLNDTGVNVANIGGGRNCRIGRFIQRMGFARS